MMRPALWKILLVSAILCLSLSAFLQALDHSFIGPLDEIKPIVSTIPQNGDINPYGVATVPRTTGRLVKGHILVSNFNNSTNLQGTGTTIVDISPGGDLKLFAQIDPHKLPGPCPGGVGLTTALTVLRSGWVIVGSLPTTAGSSFGAVVAIWLGLENVVWGIPLISVAAFIGAFLTILLVFFIARTGGALPTFTLLLAGVTLNFIFGALIMFIHYAAHFNQGYLMTRWMMGALDTADIGKVLSAAPFVVACLFGLMWMASQLNPLAAGEEWAASRGVDVRRVKNISYFIGSILTGAVTAFSGPIGFVGLIVPHTVRLLAGPDHRTLIPASFFLGAAFLVLCDTAARTIIAPTIIPVGVITALLGGPFFIFLLKRKRGELW